MPADKKKISEKRVSTSPSSASVALDPERLKRVRPIEDETPPPEPAPVSAGPIDKVIELAFNPTREKIREVTIIDRFQGRLFPIMDAANTMFLDCLEVAVYRQSRSGYEASFHRPRPVPVGIVGELMYRIAQWQKSVAGKNLERATDIALAEIETRSDNEEDAIGSGRGFEE